MSPMAFVAGLVRPMRQPSSSSSSMLYKSSHCTLLRHSLFVPSSLVNRQRQRVKVVKRKEQTLQMGLFGLGLPELGVIAGIALLIWGPKKLEGMGKELGSMAGSLKKASAEFTDAMETSMKEADEEIEKAKAERKKDREGVDDNVVETEIVEGKAAETSTKATTGVVEKD